MKKLTLIPLLFAVTACSKSYKPADFADVAAKSGSCAGAETYFHDIVQSSYEETGAIASVDDVLSEFDKSIEPLSIAQAVKKNLSSSFRIFYSKLENQINKAESKEDTLKALGQLEFGTHPDKELQEDYSKSFAKFKALATTSLNACEVPKEDDSSSDQSSIDPEPTPEEPKLPFFEELQLKTENLSQYGALKSFAIAYQSCEAISIDALTLSSDDVEGISVVGRHSSGAGNKREITSLSKTQRTHHYIKDFRKPASTCVDSTKKPLIYDFGGKPYTTSASNSTLNFFKNAGSGSKELGVDCSGYVFSSLMSAGLKLSPDKPLRARNVLSIPARAYKSPNSSMSCIKKVRAGEGMSLQSGDIFASNGHIFIVNLIGYDPLGVEAALKNNSCSSITYKDFDFTILQSSPEKGAVGMNHMDGSDYLKNSSSMRKGFEKFARLDCDNKRKNRSSTPSIDEASLVRHKMTPECISEKALKLDNESCVERCSYNG
ncbi:MAG: hypothetical protein ACRBBP_10455 [Bdellovibrionales bacterium]